jgi:integrase
VKGLLEAWVARLAECRLEQKAGYSQHATNLSGNPNILNILVRMKNNNKSDYTIRFTDKSLTLISKHADLNNPEAVKQFVASKDVSDSYKKNLCIAYNHYCKYYEIKWQMPIYRQNSKSIRIPTSEKLEKLIAYARRTLSIQLRISKETGLRPIELHNLKVKDADLEQRTVYPTTAKNGMSRTLRISHNLATAIKDHIVSHNLNPNNNRHRRSAGPGYLRRPHRMAGREKPRDGRLGYLRR